MSYPPGPWVCGECRSINADASTRCYSCRTPRVLALDLESRDAPRRQTTVDTPETRAAVARGAGAGYHTSAPFAVAAQLLIFVVTAISLARVTLVVLFTMKLDLTAEDIEPQLQQLGLLVVIRSVELGAWVVGLVAFAAWLSRVVGNLAALGGGWPHATPTSAFLTTLIPGGNLYWTTSILREAITRLSPAGAPRLGIITAWWLALVPAVLLLLDIGPLRFITRFAEEGVAVAILATGGDVETAIRSLVWLDVLGAILLLFAALLAYRLIGVIEELQAERLALLPAPAKAASPPATGAA